jgi:predicted dehydrogenase
MKRAIATVLVSAALCATAFAAENRRVKLITLDPGHFHAALVQKFMYADVDPQVNVYAPAGDDVAEHLKRIEAFNTRTESPTKWTQRVYTGPDYLERMLTERAGNVVVISGNNARKTEYIARAVAAGMNVLADKPMAISPADYARLKSAFETAKKKGVLLADIMTERYEIASILQRELSRDSALFGRLEVGTPQNPAITKESVHHFSKTVAGAALKRPQWFFDVRQEGEGLMDVGTHLVDLVQWQAFPEQSLQPQDVQVLIARRWPTAVSRAQFERVTGAADFPEFLKQDVANGALQVFSNGEVTYRLRGIVAKVSVSWKFEPPAGGGDTHYSVMRGTRANLIVRQGAEQSYKPVLYVEKSAGVSAEETETALKAALAKLQAWPGVSFRREASAWTVTVPAKYDVGHEAHFAQVTESYLSALRSGRLPDWEVPNMLTKYATLAQAYEMTHTPHATGTWQREADSLSWNSGGRKVWTLSFDARAGNKPFFHPLSVGGGPPLTQARPEDHPWHYGLWLSWKYINGMNYWEESRETNRPDGVTSWKLAKLDTRADGSATVRLDVTYTHPSGRVDLTEQRTYEISAPGTDGSYRIDWRSQFKAGAQGALLERTPMPGEPKGQVNGGYAGLGLRMAADPLRISFVSSEGAVAEFRDNRWRPNAAAVAANLSDEGRDAGGIAIVSDPANSGVAAPWYVVNAPEQQMRFLCAAVLAPKPLQLAAGEELNLHYTIALRRPAWTAEALQELAARLRGS